jgi:hypothetical protein
MVEESVSYVGKNSLIMNNPDLMLRKSILTKNDAITLKRPRIFGEENPSPCTFAIVPGSVAIAYRSHHSR